MISLRQYVTLQSCGLILTYCAFAGTPFVPEELPDVLRPADLVVIGQIHEVKSRPTLVVSTTGGEGRGEGGTAVLEVSEVLWGDLPSETSLIVKWLENWSDEDPIELKGIEDGLRGVFFLVCPSDRKEADTGYRCRITADESARVSTWRFFPLSDKSPIKELLTEYPLRMYHRPGFIVGRPVEITISFFNASPQPLRLPSLVYDDGVLSHSAGVAIVVSLDSSGASVVSPLADALRLDTTLPGTLLQPGQEDSVTVDLARLFPITSEGTFFIDIRLDGYPAQMVDAILLFDPPGNDEDD